MDEILDQCFALVEEWAASDLDGQMRVTNGLIEILREKYPERFEAAFRRGVTRPATEPAE